MHIIFKMNVNMVDIWYVCEYYLDDEDPNQGCPKKKSDFLYSCF
jgi:hypothetical protein